MRSDLAERAPFGLQSSEKPSDDPAPTANGSGREPLVTLHVIGERSDLLRVGIDRNRLLLQTTHELEPSDGEWIEAVLVSRLAFDLVVGHESCDAD